MARSALLCVFFAACAAGVAAEKGYNIQFTAKSVKSDIFVPLRANKTMVLTNQCGKEVTEPLGILEQTYRHGTTGRKEKCTWHLRAPANHVVNVISIIFVMDDEIEPGARVDDVKTSTISLYDGAKASEEALLTRYYVSTQERVGHFVQSLSSGQDMIVEIKYHDNKDFATQKMLINYEFLDYDKMIELLRANK